MRRWKMNVACMALAAGWCAANAAELSQEQELAMAFGDKSFVSIATGSRVPLTRAPSVATVITEEDIRATGATDLDEVLETVPGLHVERSAEAYAPIYAIHGVSVGLSNPQVLMLVNGIPVTTAYDGSRGNVWGSLPLENVARIEVIRGPGSALYGADAVSGVINIITKQASDIDGTQTGVRAGSFDRSDAWVLHGGKWGDADVAAYLSVGSTRGARPIITADAQSGLDAAFASLGALPVSHAPGPINIGHDNIDASIDLSQGRWRWRAALKQRDDVGSGAGVAQALDPTGRNASRRITSDLTWRDAAFAKNWDVSVQASWMHYSETSDLVLFPPGANLGAGTFQDGMLGSPYKWMQHSRLGVSSFYSGIDGHRVRIGTGYEDEDLYKIQERKNFNPDFSPIGIGSVADLTDVSNTLPFIQPHRRRLRYLYVQDEWSLVKDWTITAGVRHDRYSDFGGTTNPRLALVWEAAYDVTAKLMYGSAFRAPAFTELYAINNPVARGNPALQAEKMHTLEAALSWQASSTSHLGLNIFRYRLGDIIRLDSTGVYRNSATQTGQGLELEAGCEPRHDMKLAASYGYQHAHDEATGQDPGLSPRHHAQLRADWHWARAWQADSQLNLVGVRRREPGDPRPPLAGYATVDVTLRTLRMKGAVDLAFSVRNLFDADAREPSQFGLPFTSIPNDLPLPGRSFFVQAVYKF